MPSILIILLTFLGVLVDISGQKTSNADSVTNGLQDDDNSEIIGLSTASPGIVISGLGKYKYLGGTVCSVDDVNGDGYGDILVLGGSDPKKTSVYGTLYLVFGSRLANNVDVEQMSTTEGIEITGNFLFGGNFNFYTACSAVGDVNGDGYNDFAIGAGLNLYVIFGTKYFTDFSVNTMSSSKGFKVSNLAKGSSLTSNKQFSFVFAVLIILWTYFNRLGSFCCKRCRRRWIC